MSTASLDRTRWTHENIAALRANLALLENNAAVATQIALALATRR